jgi:putative SOS response-associated peptidase YedK
MCGRYSDSRIPKHLRKSRFPRVTMDLVFSPRYNVAPTQKVKVELVENGQLFEKEMTWGFLPKWATAPIINAQQETIATKPTFKNSFVSHRCLIRADGFYEWKRNGDLKIPHRFVLKDGESFYFAGIWDRFKKAKRPEQPIGDLFAAPPVEEPTEFDGFLVLTTVANDVTRPIHNRMPVIVRPENCDDWLDPETSEGKLKEIVEHPLNDELSVYEVSPVVNNAKNERAECIASIA